MSYSIKVVRIGQAGVPVGDPDLYETPDEANAITIAAFAVDTAEAEQRRVATVRDTAGRVVMSYVGRSRDGGR